MKYSLRPLDRVDALISALSGIAALAVYVRTLAPDVLYGDSAEFQTLVYTLGHTHSTGYPIYLFLARLVGFLPIQSPAWRVNLFSALMAALAVAGVYLVARHLTNSRAGACLGALGLALSFTMWSQAIIAEVYAPAAGFLAWIYFFVLRWLQDPKQRGRSLFVAGLLSGLSLGMHATTALAALPSAGLVLLWLLVKRANWIEWRRTLLAGAGGALLGAFIFVAGFLYIDWHNPPASFVNTTLNPSRAIWGLAPEDLDTPLERITLTLNSIQWKDVLFAGGTDAAVESWSDYMGGMITQEFSLAFLLLGLYGWWVLLPRGWWRGGYLLASFLLVWFYVLNYHPDDQYVFFLSTYVAFSAVTGAGIGTLVENITRWKFIAKRGWGPAVGLCLVVVLAVIVLWPPLSQRAAALQTGKASFVGENYQFPVNNLKEPRLLGQMYLSGFPDNAVVLLEWRNLHAVSYLAYVEKKKPDLIVLEAMPRGNDGGLSVSMIETIHQYLAEGRPVFAAQRFDGLRENFRLMIASNNFVQVFEKK
jgi:hypothetical protein